MKPILTLSWVLLALLPIVTNAEAWIAWQRVGDRIPAPIGGKTGDPERGRALVVDRHKGNCLACHALPIPDQPFQGDIGPPLHGVGLRLTPAQLRLRVADEKQLNPETIMPGYYRDPRRFRMVDYRHEGQTILDAQEIEDIVAFLSTLKTPLDPEAARHLATPVSLPRDRPVSGYALLNESTREMQDDEFANPGMAEVDRGRRLFHQIGNNGKSCATCHGEDGAKLNARAIAAFPKWNAEFEEPFTLQKQINLCWEDQLDNVPWVYDCTELVALEAFVRYKARGEPIAVDVSGPMKPHYEAGRELYFMRFGQMDMSCHLCHDVYAGHHLRGQVLGQGHVNGFPEYRLGSGRMTSLHRRMTECFVSFRAEPFDKGSDEFIDLEIYLHARSNGLPIETPAVRY